MNLGAKGDDVRMLQLHLAAHGFMTGVVDGDFGPRTDAAVRAFQKARGLVVDGEVGPKTWAEVMRFAATEYPVRRCYPLRALHDMRLPHITSRHAIHNPERPNHRGVDLFFKRLASDLPMKLGDGGATKHWWIPPGTLAISAAAGVIEIAGPSPTGRRVWVRHEGGLATGGFHLRDIRVKQGEAVEMGVDLGECGDNPRDHDAVHLHWEVYRGPFIDEDGDSTYPRGTVDPEIWLRGASVLPAK